MDDDSDDMSLEAEHLRELTRELSRAKRKWDADKITRLLSLTFKVQSQKHVSSSRDRISGTLEEFSCFKEPAYVRKLVL